MEWAESLVTAGSVWWHIRLVNARAAVVNGRCGSVAEPRGVNCGGIGNSGNRDNPGMLFEMRPAVQAA